MSFRLSCERWVTVILKFNNVPKNYQLAKGFYVLLAVFGSNLVADGLCYEEDGEIFDGMDIWAQSAAGPLVNMSKILDNLYVVM